MASLNTLPGYEVESATPIADEDDPGIGLSAGDRVEIDEDHEMYGGETGVVQAIARGQGAWDGQIVVDVLVEGTSDAERFSSEDVYAL